MKHLIFANLATRRAEADIAGTPYTWPPFTFGDTVRIALRFSDLSAGQRITRSLNVHAGRVSLGWIDRRPITGRWNLRIGDGPYDSSNTTELLDWNASPSQIGDAINALTDVVDAYGTVWVEMIDDSLILVFGDGDQIVPLSIGFNSLQPVSFGRITHQLVGGIYQHEIRLTQAPLASTVESRRVLPEAPSIETIQNGGTQDGFEWAEIQKLTLPAEFRGTYIIRYQTFLRTRAIGWEEGPEAVQTAINTMLASLNYTVEINNASTGEGIITFGGDAMGVNVDQLTVEVFDAPEGDLTFDLDLNTYEAATALRSTPELKEVPMEIELKVYDDGEDPEDPETPPKTITVIQQLVTLRRELQWEGLQAAAPIDWLRPPHGLSYVPFTLNQIITGQQHHTSVIGDDEALAFTIDHQLGTEALASVSVRENLVGGEILPDDDYTVAIEGPDSITITFPSAPASGAYAVVITAAGPASAFQNHTHTIAQIENLQSILDDFGGRIETLETVLPTTNPGQVEEDAQPLDIIIPTVLTMLPSHETPEFDLASAFRSIDTAQLPCATGLYPALHDDSTSALPVPPGEASAASAGVFVNQSGDRQLVPIGLQGIERYIENGDAVGNNGSVWFPVRQESTTTTWHPKDFELDLFLFHVNGSMLRVGRTLTVNLALRTRLFSTASFLRTQAQWVVELQVGEYQSETNPATTGINISTINWLTPSLEHRIILSDVLTTHLFGLRIQRAVGGLSADRMLYGAWEGGATAPSTANFIVRARLTKFDVGDSLVDPGAFITLEMPTGTGQSDGGDDSGGESDSENLTTSATIA